eukprot:6191717-Pleurochrysis_carterae.AAC.2
MNKRMDSINSYMRYRNLKPELQVSRSERGTEKWATRRMHETERFCSLLRACLRIRGHMLIHGVRVTCLHLLVAADTDPAILFVLLEPTICLRRAGLSKWAPLRRGEPIFKIACDSGEVHTTRVCVRGGEPEPGGPQAYVAHNKYVQGACLGQGMGAGRHEELELRDGWVGARGGRGDRVSQGR